MNRADILKELKQILVDAEEITAEEAEAASESSDLKEDLGLNSVDLLYTVIAIEDTFHVRFTEVSMSDFVTVGDVVSCIEKKL